MDIAGQGCNFLQYTYLVVMVAVITTKLRCHPLLPRRGETMECSTPYFLMASIWGKERTTLVYLNKKWNNNKNNNKKQQHVF